MATELAKAIGDDYIRDMDRRLIILETRFDTILPTLATKADLMELRADLRDEIYGLYKWMAATCISLLLGFAGLSLTLLSQNHAQMRVLEQLVAAQQPH